MADVKWTLQQKNAIEAREGTVLVSAAAGSGKTAVLVQRVIEMITDEKNPYNIDELVIVTFTKAAAAQMKEKINAALEKCISAEKNIENRNRLLKQQMILPTAKICTIDSFCSDIVKSNFQAVDISFDYKILDGATEKVYRKQAYDEVAEKYYEEGSEEFNALADMYTSGSDDGSLEGIVMDIFGFSQSYPCPEEWINSIETKLADERSDRQNGFVKILADYISSLSGYCADLAEFALKRAAEDGSFTEKYLALLSEEYSYFREISDSAEKLETEKDWDELVYLVRKKTRFDTIPGSKKFNEQISVSNKNIRDKYKNYFEKIRSALPTTSEENKNDSRKIMPVMKMLAKITVDFYHRFSEIKRENNCADFSDVLHYALDILLEKKDGKYIKTDIAERYSDEFKAILVDEYQDTNEAQDELFKAISKDGKNLFFVGDVKQSIYGFRQAMPKIFNDKKRSYELYDRDKNNYPATIILDKNFRSRKGITDFINFTFDQIMSEETGEIEYNKAERLYPAAEYPEKEGADVSLHIIDSSDAPEDFDKIAYQSVYIAKIIKKMIDDGETVGSGENVRPIKLSDFCILLRNKKNAGVMMNILTDCGINAYVNENGNLFEQMEIRMIIALLKVIDNPVNDVNLLTVMTSPFGGFSVNEVSEIRARNKSGSFYQAVSEDAEKGNEKSRYFLNMLEEYRMMSSALPTGQFIRYIISKSGFDSVVSVWDDGEIKRRNIDILKKYADSFFAENNVGLSSFVRMLDRLRESGSVKAAARVSGSDDSVAIMSIHKSKGLEFPVCILAECEKQFNRNSQRTNLIAHPESGVGIMGSDSVRMIRYETLSHTALKIEKEKSEMSEELRVLYVAMTRAKEKLIMVATEKNPEDKFVKFSSYFTTEKINPLVVRRAPDYFSLILMSAMRYPGQKFFKNRSLINIKDYDLNDISPMDVFLVNAEECMFFSQIDYDNSIENETEANEEITEVIREKAEYVYPYKKLAGVLAKRSASHSEKVGINRDFFASSRPAFMDNFGLTPAQRGTAMHLFMQHADYKEASENLEGEILRLNEAGFLNDLQVSSLDRNRLKKFFTSHLAKRMLSSPNVFREKKFIIKIPVSEIEENIEGYYDDESVVVQGIIDCAFEENGKIILIDYKTDRVSNPEQLRERYSSQLDIYKRAVRECLGYEIEKTVLYSFFLNQEVEL